MNSSGIKRGLAVSAISALAVTGMPANAFADTVNQQVGPGPDTIVLYSGYSSSDFSVKNDGQNSTIRLEAGASADVSSVTFQYRISDAAAWQDIATVSRNDDGAFSTEWAPGAALIGGNVDVRAIEAGNAAVASNQADNFDILGGGAPEAAVNLTDAGAVGVFQSPYAADDNFVIVSGTASENGPVAIAELTGTTVAGPPVKAATGVTDTFTAATPTGGTVAAFKDVLDLGAYGFTPGDTNELVLGATNDTDDVESYSLYRQTITQVVAEAENTQVPGSETTAVTVTVLDQNGNPIAGARVLRSDNTGTDFTDENGEAQFTQGAGTFFYYADATNSPGYEAGLGDKRSADIAVTQYNPAPTTLDADSVDGDAFDDQEYTLGNVTVQIKDQAGNDFEQALRTVNYYWVITPFDGSPATIRVPGTGTSTAVTDATGEANIVVPVGEESGTYELFAGLAADGLGNGAIAPASVLTVKVGQAAITYDEASPQSAPAGTSETINGKLALEDGTGLPGRVIDLDWDTATSGSDTSYDAGIVQADGTTGPTRTVTTGAQGGFSAVIKDAAENPQGTELGGNLDAVTGTTPGIGDSVTSKDDQVVNFFTNAVPGSTTITIADNAGNGTPGVAEAGSLTVLGDTDNDPTTAVAPVVGLAVTLSVDDGFFTDGTPDPAAAEGGDAGELRSLGKTITVVTGAGGIATFQHTIERDDEFDDDGLANAVVTATAGSVSDTETFDYSSENPLNGGSIEVVPTEDRVQQSSVLPDARTDQDVVFDVFVTDQFGNRVGGEVVTISEGSPFASIDATDTDAGAPGIQIESDYDELGDFVVSSGGRPGDVVVTATTMMDTLKYTAAPPATVSSMETLTDSYTVSFYEVDYAASDVTLTSSANGPVAPGTTVTETVTVVDQNGQPVDGLTVEFLRSGPSAQDGDVNFVTSTNRNGVATYNFVGTEEGTANITAVVRDGNTQVASLSDSVVFGEPDPVVDEVIASLRGQNNGARADRLRVVTGPAADGARVRLFRVVNGDRTRVGQTTLNDAGVARFRVADRNGRGFTKYVAIVGATNDTTRDVSNRKRVR